MALRSRHRATAFLDNVIALAPRASWVATLPHGKLPDRNDFPRYGTDHAGRARDWTRAAAESLCVPCVKGRP